MKKTNTRYGTIALHIFFLRCPHTVKKEWACRDAHLYCAKRMPVCGDPLGLHRQTLNASVVGSRRNGITAFSLAAVPTSAAAAAVAGAAAIVMIVCK